MKKFNSWIEENKGLWHNIHMKRKRGERMRKKGEKGAPSPEALRRAKGEETQKEDAPANAVAHGGVDMNPTGRPRKMDKRMRYHPDSMFRRTKKLTDGAIDKILQKRMK